MPRSAALALAYFVVLCGVLFLASEARAIDPISCLAAKPKFGDCAKIAAEEQLPLRSCLDADAGYVDCRAFEGPGSHTRCLGTKSNYKFCREDGNNHFTCVLADSGYRDCMKIEDNTQICVLAKGGYGPCRVANKHFPHQGCLAADNGYKDCLALGGSHFVCIRARRSYKYCREVDHQSHVFCTRIGRGYQECRKAGHSLAHCVQADTGFADCRAHKEP